MKNELLRNPKFKKSLFLLCVQKLLIKYRFFQKDNFSPFFSPSRPQKLQNINYLKIFSQITTFFLLFLLKKIFLILLDLKILIKINKIINLIKNKILFFYSKKFLFFLNMGKKKLTENQKKELILVKYT